MDVDTHLLKFLLCDSMFIPVSSLISSARRHLAFFLPLTLLLFLLSISFFLAILFRMNNIFFPLLVLVQRTVQCCCSCVAEFKAKILTCFVLFRRFHFTVLFCTPYRSACTVVVAQVLSRSYRIISFVLYSNFKIPYADI